MYRLNRQRRYEIIKAIINDKNIENDPTFGDIKSQLISYLDEMHECWNSNYTDVTDRQYITILNDDDEKTLHK